MTSQSPDADKTAVLLRAPALNIPTSSNTVKVQIIDTTAQIRCNADYFLSPAVGGLDVLVFKVYAFLIENAGSGKKVLFDLGVRRDWENLATPMVERLREIFDVDVKKGVSQILEENGVGLEEISSIIWRLVDSVSAGISQSCELILQLSHWHFDHIGDPSTFPPTTSLIVGPGTTAAKLPPWPENALSTLTKSDTKGRTLIEIQQQQFVTEIGRFRGFDFFGDGSFYLLDVPGHAVGHMCGLARTTQNTFLLMGADTCHHGGQYRPSEFVPLPDEILPNPFNAASKQGCPCSIFENIHPNPKEFRTKNFYDIKINQDGTSVAKDVDQAYKSIHSLQEFDAADNVFIVCAHDKSLVGIVDVFPKYANHWKDADWKIKGRWKFLADWGSGRFE